MYLCKVYLLKEHMLAWFCVHACAKYIMTGSYVLVNTECVCKQHREYNVLAICAEYGLMHKL